MSDLFQLPPLLGSQIADAVIRARSGLKEAKRPSGSFIFLGAIRVGKTKLDRSRTAAVYGVKISESGAARAKWAGLRVTMGFAPLRRAKVAWSES